MNTQLQPQQQQRQQQRVVPGDASWLGVGYTKDLTPRDFESYLPLLYVIMGSQAVAIPRVILLPNQECPELILTNLNLKNHIDIPKVRVRGVGDWELPYAFPIKICETHLKTIEQKQAWSNGQLVFDGLEDRNPIPIPTNPKRTLLVGDTGLRSKAANFGLGACPVGPTLYGVPQCPFNFTASDLNQTAEGSFQSLEDWTLPDVLGHAANTNPDLVIHMGDYFYRQSPCPANNTLQADCASINMPTNFETTDIPNDDRVVFDFLPGFWGDNFFGWFADFFYPALPILKKAPLIAIRGNHENCQRGGHGYFFLLSPLPYNSHNPNSKAGSWCLDYSPPYSIPFEKEQFLVLDDSIIDPENDGVDHLNFTKGACPKPPKDGSLIVPAPMDRWDDPTQSADNIKQQIHIFSKYMQEIEALSQSHETNFFLTHRPIFAVACNFSEMVTMDWTLQQSLGKNTLNRVVAVMGGHMHWLSALSFNQSLPVQLVLGHGGTERIPNFVEQDIFSSLQLELEFGPIQPDGSPLLRGKVHKGITDSSMYGFALMERSTETDDYNVRFLGLNDTENSFGDNQRSSLVEIDFRLTIPKGPRVPSGSREGTNANTGIDGETWYPGICIKDLTMYMIFIALLLGLYLAVKYTVLNRSRSAPSEIGKPGYVKLKTYDTFASWDDP